MCVYSIVNTLAVVVLIPSRAKLPAVNFLFFPIPSLFLLNFFFLLLRFFNKIPTIQQLQKTSKGGDKEGDLLYKPTAKPYTRLNYDKDQPTKSMVGS